MLKEKREGESQWKRRKRGGGERDEVMRGEELNPGGGA